jgi:predicted metalloprotease with PDZ domain
MLLTVLLAAAVPAATVKVDLDATEIPRRLLRARLEIPAEPGPLTLLYPKWIPGEHAPTGPVVDLAGLVFTAGGKPIPWRRDSADMYAFHLDVPAGSRNVEVALEYLSPTGTTGYTSSVNASSELALLSWNHVVLYPKGRGPDELMYAASLRLPSGWKQASSLRVAKQNDERIEMAPVSLTTLVDSPVLAGAHFRSIPLSADPPVSLHIAADSPPALEITPAQQSGYERLVTEADALFGGRHYRSYHFLMALSDRVSHFGHEHHESSDNRLGERALVDDAPRKSRIALLPHEMVHSWNGKYRRPAGLATADFHQPMQGDLLWVYEGLTVYLADVLTARSGLRSVEDTRDSLAWMAGNMAAARGRVWRPLGDTAVSAQLLYEARSDWASRRRGVDFYQEGGLLWLEADVVIRGATKGRKSLDDFCRLFFGGGKHGPPEVVPYTFDDVVRALEAVAPHDWRAFWKARVETVVPDLPAGGFTGTGWKLGYAEDATGFFRTREDQGKGADLRHSIGLAVADDGAIRDVVPGSPVDRAGIGPAMKVAAVNGRKYSKAHLRAAVRGTTKDSGGLELLVENGDWFKTYRLEYTGGERYPVLVREAGSPDMLAEILKPRAAKR